MRVLRALCRILFALTFIVSGALKLLDPVGTGLIVKEYLDFMHLGFLESAAVALGIAWPRWNSPSASASSAACASASWPGLP